MESLWNLYDLLGEKVDEVVKTGDLSANEMDCVYKAAKTMYYIECINAMAEGIDEYDGMSGNWPYSSNASMRRGRSSRTNGGNISGRRSSRANNSMRNYSGHDQKEMMLQKIAEMQRQIEDME